MCQPETRRREIQGRTPCNMTAALHIGVIQMSAGARSLCSRRPALPCAAVLLTALVLPPPAARAQGAQPFDGRWTTTVTCKSAKDPAGVKFVTEVRDGVLGGQAGTEGAPGFLRIDG